MRDGAGLALGPGGEGKGFEPTRSTLVPEFDDGSEGGCRESGWVVHGTGVGWPDSGGGWCGWLAGHRLVVGCGR